MNPVRRLETSVSSRASAPLMTSGLDLIVSMDVDVQIVTTRATPLRIDGETSDGRGGPPCQSGNETSKVDCSRLGKLAFADD